MSNRYSIKSRGGSGHRIDIRPAGCATSIFSLALCIGALLTMDIMSVQFVPDNDLNQDVKLSEPGFSGLRDCRDFLCFLDNPEIL